MEQIEETINIKIEESLNHLAASKGKDISNELKPILLKNLSNGRAQTYIENNFAHLDEYLNLLFEKFNRWHNYIHKVQDQRDPLVWNQLFPQLITFAYAFFIRKGFDSGSNTYDYAQESATNAATALLNANFPYDIDFDPWAHRIVQIHCLRFMRDEMRKREIPADNLIELSDEIETNQDEQDALQPMLEAELQAAIAAALEQLPQARQDVIRWRYFDQLSYDEIASRMGKSLDAVYGLQFNALREMQKILSKNGIDFNER
jgi:RNA polymerase sigma factor, sigma-70 family